MEQAETHGLAGEHDKCLGICWELRNDPNVGLYRRALVSLLIACVADYSKYPNKAKYAHECLALFAQLRREGIHLDDEKEIKAWEDHARQALKDIEEEARLYAAQVEKDKVRRDAEESSATQGDEDVEGTQEQSSETAQDVEDDSTFVPWTLKGAFTDTRVGPRVALPADPPSKPSAREHEGGRETTSASMEPSAD